MSARTLQRSLWLVVICAAIASFFILRSAVREGWPDAQRIEVAR